MRILSIVLFLLIVSPPAFAADFRLIETTGDLVQVSDFQSAEELQAHKEKRMKASPESSFKEEDHSAEEAKVKAEKDKLDNFEFKGTTIAQLRAELNDLLKLQKGK